MSPRHGVGVEEWVIDEYADGQWYPNGTKEGEWRSSADSWDADPRSGRGFI